MIKMYLGVERSLEDERLMEDGWGWAFGGCHQSSSFIKSAKKWRQNEWGFWFFVFISMNQNGGCVVIILSSSTLGTQHIFLHISNTNLLICNVSVQSSTKDRMEPNRSKFENCIIIIHHFLLHPSGRSNFQPRAVQLKGSPTWP